MNTSHLRIISACLLALTWATAGNLLAQSAPTLTEGARWESNASLGFTLTRGNSDSVLTTANVSAARRRGGDETALSASTAYGENDGRRNADNQRLSAQQNRLVSEDTFLYGRAEWMRDPVARLEYRLALSPGGGHYFWREEQRGFFRAELGPCVVLEEKGGVADEDFTLRAAERFEYKLNDTAKLWHSFEFMPDVNRFESHRITAELGVEAKLAGNLRLRAFVQDTFNSEPALGREANDLRMVTQLGYAF